NPCYYGIDMSTREELIAANKEIEDIRAVLEADSVAYLSPEGLEKAIVKDKTINQGICNACMTGQYPVRTEENKQSFLTNEKFAGGFTIMSNRYKEAGVDVEKGYEAVERMKKHINKTTRPEVLGGVGAFAGLFELTSLKF